MNRVQVVAVAVEAVDLDENNNMIVVDVPWFQWSLLLDGQAWLLGSDVEHESPLPLPTYPRRTYGGHETEAGVIAQGEAIVAEFRRVLKEHGVPAQFATECVNNPKNWQQLSDQRVRYLGKRVRADHPELFPVYPSRL